MLEFYFNFDPSRQFSSRSRSLSLSLSLFYYLFFSALLGQHLLNLTLIFTVILHLLTLTLIRRIVIAPNPNPNLNPNSAPRCSLLHCTVELWVTTQEVVTFAVSEKLKALM